MSSRATEIAVVSGSSHPSLARGIAEAIGLTVGKVVIDHFPDGEISVIVEEEVRGKEVFIVQSLAQNPNHYLMELLIIIDALKRAAARAIVPVVTYFGYARQDRRDRPQVPITAKLVARLLETAGASRLIAVDLHAPQVEGFFDIPVDHLRGQQLLCQGIVGVDNDNLVVGAPDVGSIKIARTMAALLNADFVVVDKQRRSAAEVEILNIIGDVAGKDILLADDMCTTGSTLVSAAKACREKGARHIYGAVTHGVFVDGAVEKIEESPLEWLLVTDTVAWTARLAGASKIRVVTTVPLFAQAIRC